MKLNSIYAVACECIRRYIRSANKIEKKNIFNILHLNSAIDSLTRSAFCIDLAFIARQESVTFYLKLVFICNRVFFHFLFEKACGR